jgi:hypothetical protein
MRPPAPARYADCAADIRACLTLLNPSDSQHVQPRLKVLRRLALALLYQGGDTRSHPFAKEIERILEQVSQGSAYEYTHSATTLSR